jgi:DNA-directed RNA polymerase specialized sigma24 family protein
MIPVEFAAAAAPALRQSSGCDPDLWLYRDRTVGLLKRYLRYSVEVGRLPSLLGREFFRTRVTSYHAGTFEDAVIFVHDVERALERLDEFERKLIARIVLQEYTHTEAAQLLGCWRRTVGRRFPEALDRLSEIFLKAGLLIYLPTANSRVTEDCQGVKPERIRVSHST